MEIRTTRLFIVLGNIKKEIVFADFAQFCTFCTDLFLLMPKYVKTNQHLLLWIIAKLAHKNCLFLVENP